MAISLKDIRGSAVVIEDADDMEKNFKWLSWRSGTGGTQGEFSVNPNNPAYIDIYAIDLYGNIVSPAGMGGAEADISYDEGLTFDTVNLSYYGTGNGLSWPGINTSKSKIQIRPHLEEYREPLSSGDTLVYNDARGKFKPVNVIQESLKWNVIDTNRQLEDGDKLIVDTSEENLVLILPVGEFYEISIKRLGAGEVTIYRNDHLINGREADYVMEVDGQSITLTHVGEDKGVIFTSNIGGLDIEDEPTEGIFIDSETGNISIKYT